MRRRLISAAPNSDTPFATAIVSGDQSDKVVTFDISDESSLAELDNVSNATAWDFGAGPIAIDDANKIAYCRGFNKGYASVDVSTPSAISVLDAVALAYQTNGQDAAFSTTQDYVYFSPAASDRVISVDVSTPSAMATDDQLASSVYADDSRGVALDDARNVLFVVSDDDNAITSVDVSDPSNLAGISVLSDGTNLLNPCAVEVDPESQIAFVFGDGGFSTIDVSNTSSMSRLDTDTTAGGGFPAYAGIAYDATNQIAVLASEGEGVYFIDVSNPSAISVSGSITTAIAGSTNFRDVAVDPSRSVAFVVMDEATGVLASINYANPASPSVIDTISSANIAGAYGIGLMT